MRSMVEGHARVFLRARRGSENSPVPLHHPCGMVPLPRWGRNYRALGMH